MTTPIPCDSGWQQHMHSLPNRRTILKSGAGFVVGATLPNLVCKRSTAKEARREKLPVAAIVSVYRHNSHADVIVGKILDGYGQTGGPGPDLKIVSLFSDQVPDQDMSRTKARQHGFRIATTIDEALTLGTNKLQVAGVLSIGEHGTYPLTPLTQQRMYPRRRFFDEIVATFDRCDHAVPVFNDKHLGYEWTDAVAMVQASRNRKFPLLAGSSLPLAWRSPPTELPADCEIEAALTIGYGGLEDYGFHALEAQQCLIEKRRGGESGVSAVSTVPGVRLNEYLAGDELSAQLFAAARRSMPGAPEDTVDWQPSASSAAYCIEHRDGLKSSIVMANGLANHFATAIKLKGRTEPFAVWFQLQEGPPFGHFAYLVHAIDHLIHTGQSPYPVERTLLTTGILDRVMHSLARDGERSVTPELAMTYRMTDWPYANHPDSKLLVPKG